MKKLLLSISFFALGFIANAQTKKSTWLLGGGLSFSSQKNFSSFYVYPDIGYFIQDNLVVGGYLDIGTSKVKDADASNSLLVGPFVRYYFANLGDKVKLFSDASFGFGSEKQSGTSSEYTKWQLLAGPAFFLNESIALEAKLNYSSQKFKNTDASNSFGLIVGFRIHFKNDKK
jgi:Outer membrane protein beta-barrel domain